jgi:outer membrane protein assembly factor BamB
LLNIGVMRTTSAVAILGASLAASLQAGCVPFGCGGADPEMVSTFTLTPGTTMTVSSPITGIAAAPDGVWMMTLDHDLVEYDHLGGAELHRVHVDGETLAFYGLAWDGASLWTIADGGATPQAWKLDPATGARRATVALPAYAMGLAWDGSNLQVVEGGAGIDTIDPVRGALIASTEVRRVANVGAIAYHDGETWVAGSASPEVLVYDTTGTLLATATGAAKDEINGPLMGLAFVGDQLVISNGVQLHVYTIERTAPTPL